ncbi:MAG: hypothetical protein AVDCRST_MAG45-2364 [uncultured Solirubrobacterales bacterium]|uniref:Uncharacterized protein n=1 Tax=uncultured Solirubrobacterales bacterium TaxID=768556 RepID=A0A6J4TBB9_9ACTN|nr:MAG: hypothetical protein AVDCRST_MAG45-2364 [uncultured Solirubrobacterales bacterium]
MAGEQAQLDAEVVRGGLRTGGAPRMRRPERPDATAWRRERVENFTPAS